MALDPVTAIADFAGKLLDIGGKFIPDEGKRLEFEKAVLDASTRQQEAVNATMQAEAKSEHWMQWAWRPTVGFTFAGVIINNYILLPYFASFGLKPLDIPEGIWSAMLVVLGVAAGTRGLQKWQKEKNK